MIAYSINAKKTKNMNAIIHEEIAVIPSVFGEMSIMVLKMFVATRKRVTRRPTRPGIESGGIRKLTQETLTNIPVGK